MSQSVGQRVCCQCLSMSLHPGSSPSFLEVKEPSVTIQACRRTSTTTLPIHLASPPLPGLAPAGALLPCSCNEVGKEARPAAPALRASLPPAASPGCPLNSLRSDNAARIPRRNCLRSAGQRGFHTHPDRRVDALWVCSGCRLKATPTYPRGNATDDGIVSTFRKY